MSFLAILWNSAFSWVYFSLSPLLFASFLSSSICKTSSDNHKSVVSHLEPDTLECEVKRALGSTAVNKASGCNGIPVELFKTLKDDGIRVLAFNMSANLEDPGVAMGLEKVNPHPNSQEG